MKILNLPLLTFTLSFIQSIEAIKEGCLRQDDSFTGLMFEGSCDLDHVKKALIDELAQRPNQACLNWKKELADLFQMSKDDAFTQVGIVCAKAEEDVLEDADFYDILDLEADDGDEQRFLKEFYDGGTRLNEEYDDIEEDHNLSSDTQSIEDFYDNQLTTSRVSFPDEIENFDNCDYNSVMCW